MSNYVRGGHTAGTLQRGGGTQFGRTVSISGKEGGLECACGHREPAHKKKHGACFYQDCDCKKFFEKRVKVRDV